MAAFGASSSFEVRARRACSRTQSCPSTGVQVGAIFDARALLTPPPAAERMVRLSTREWVFVQKCLLERKCTYWIIPSGGAVQQPPDARRQRGSE
jgi:hypothetical protein